MENWNSREKELYAQSRALKMQARELRKKRLAKMADEAEDLRKKNTKLDKDARIRRALISFLDSLKKERLCLVTDGFYGDKSHIFSIVDSKGLPGPTIKVADYVTDTSTKINLVAGKGFEWD